MSTDRELLEAAAMAAGIDRLSFGTDGRAWIAEGPYPNKYTPWNPLTDDGDALRLAVRLGLDFYEGDDDGRAAYVGYYTPAGNTRPQRFVIERHDAHPDSYAAARRAITRAAAAIGATTAQQDPKAAPGEGKS